MPATKERHNLTSVHDAIRRRANFTCNNTLVGLNWSDFGIGGMGRLPERFHSQYQGDMMSKGFYVVKSYDTPIAWFTRGQWVIPDVKYSVTTSRHQNIVRKGIA